MFCHNCGAKLPDNAKFCIECGERASNYTKKTPDEVTTGLLYITRKHNECGLQIPVKIYINGICEAEIEDDETLKITLDISEYRISLQYEGNVILDRLVKIDPEQPEEIEFDTNTRLVNTRNTSKTIPVRNQNNSYPAPVSNPQKCRICPKCGGYMQIQTVSESRQSGCGTVLLYLLLAITVIGILIIIPLALRKKTETVTYAVCQKCGYTQTLSRR